MKFKMEQTLEQKAVWLKAKLDAAIAEEERCKKLVIRAAEWKRDQAHSDLAIASVDARKAKKKYDEILVELSK